LREAQNGIVVVGDQFIEFIKERSSASRTHAT
jgi:hypothetical protein